MKHENAHRIKKLFTVSEQVIICKRKSKKISSKLDVSSSSPVLPGVEMSHHRSSHSLVLGGGIEDKGGDNVRVNVRGRSSVLNVSFTIISGNLSGDSERGSSVSNSEGESLNRRGLVVTSESLLIIITVGITVKGVVLSESLHHVENVLHTTSSLSHDFSREVSVASRSVPVGEKLGSIRNSDTVIFRNSGEEVTRHQ